MHMAGNQPKGEHESEQSREPRGHASPHGHTGEGSASVLAHLISQNERQRRENGESRQARSDEHP